uniref:Histone acetyltransferase n=1 Tax=Trichobilharzia regenti TaxID=157069 RepID=A0AA85IUH8_TRIRE|nr:unnamed protein product [Trichobilharzia regenti]
MELNKLTSELSKGQAQNGGPTTYVAINNMFPASPSSMPNTPGTILSMPTNLMPSTQSMNNTTPFLLSSNNFSTNPTNLTCTVPLSSPPQLQGPMLPFFAPTSGNLLSSNSSNLSVPSPYGTPMSHFLPSGQSNNNSLSTFASTVSSSGNVSTVPVSLYPSNNQLSLTSMSSNILSSSQPMVLPTLPVAFSNHQAQTSSVGVLPISLSIPPQSPSSSTSASSSSLSNNQNTETTNSYLVSSSNYTTPLYTATLYPLSNSNAILPVTTTFSTLSTNINTTTPYSAPISTSLPSSSSSTTTPGVNNDCPMAPVTFSSASSSPSSSLVKAEKPLYTTIPLSSGKFTNVRNIQALEAVDFHRDAILDAIDKLRERKARPDFERISCLLKRHQNIGYEQTQFCLQRLADAGAVVCVDYKGNLSYRNPSKWRKTAAISGIGNTNLPSVSGKLIEAMHLLIESSNNLLNPSTGKTGNNLIPYCRPGPNGGYSLFQVERALLFLNNNNSKNNNNSSNADDNCTSNSSSTSSPPPPASSLSSPELTGATLRVCLDREATHGKLAKTIDGRYILDETGERKRLYRKANTIHPSQMSNKKLLPPNTASSAYLASSGCKLSKTNSMNDRNSSGNTTTSTNTTCGTTVTTIATPHPPVAVVATPTRLHPLAAKQTPTSMTPNGKPNSLPISSNFTMPPLTTSGGRRGRPPGSKAKKTLSDINSSAKRLKVEIPVSTYGNTLINIGTNGVSSHGSVDTTGVLNTSSSTSSSSSSSLFIPNTNPSNLISTSCYTSNNISDLSFSSSIPILPSNSFITVIASNNSNNNNCSNLLPGGGTTILPTHFSTASSIPIDSSLMTGISSPFLSFPLSQGLAIPTIFSSTPNLSNDFTITPTNTNTTTTNVTAPQLIPPIKSNGLSTPDSFIISDVDSCGTIDNKQDERDNPVSCCCCCNGLATCEEPFLTCKDCGLHAHPTCLDYWPELTERARQSPWQCADCKTCTVCNNNDKYNNDLIICDACDKGFHIECHQPKLEEPIDRSLPWVCTNCQNEGYRVAIGTLPNEVNNQSNMKASNNNHNNNTNDSGNDDNKMNISEEYIKSPLKEINSSSHDISMKIDSKLESNESKAEQEQRQQEVEEEAEESQLKSSTASSSSPLPMNTSNSISNENIPLKNMNSNNHSSPGGDGNKSSSTPSKLDNLNINNNNHRNNSSINTDNNDVCQVENIDESISEQQMNPINSPNNKSGKSMSQEITENGRKTPTSTLNSSFDYQCTTPTKNNDNSTSHIIDNNNCNNNNNNELKNQIERKNDLTTPDNNHNNNNNSNHESSLSSSLLSSSSLSNRPIDVNAWTVEHVQQWLLDEGFPREAEAFYQQEIDGTCLLLMKRMDVLTELGIKLGPAVKIYERIKRFQSQCGSPT